MLWLKDTPKEITELIQAATYKNSLIQMTGSRIISPRHLSNKSDYDIVVYTPTISPYAHTYLNLHADLLGEDYAGVPDEWVVYDLRKAIAGKEVKINFMVCHTKEAFDLWELQTEIATHLSPVTKEERITIFEVIDTLYRVSPSILNWKNSDYSLNFYVKKKND